MTHKKYKTLFSMILALILLALVILLHGFRVEREDNPALGLFEYRYSWWRPREIGLDSNRDGSIDVRIVLDDEATDFGFPPRKYLEDRNFDGLYEIRVLYSAGHIEAVDFDEDFDGTYDRRLTGVEAEHFFDRFLEPPKQKMTRPAPL